MRALCVYETMARHELTEKLDEIAHGGLSVRSAHVRLIPGRRGLQRSPRGGEAAHPRAVSVVCWPTLTSARLAETVSSSPHSIPWPQRTLSTRRVGNFEVCSRKARVKSKTNTTRRQNGKSSSSIASSPRTVEAPTPAVCAGAHITRLAALTDGLPSVQRPVTLASDAGLSRRSPGATLVPPTARWAGMPVVGMSPVTPSEALYRRGEEAI